MTFARNAPTCLPLAPTACRLAAQQLGLLSLVGELQDAWAQAEAAWQSVPPADSHSGDGGSAVEPPEAEQPQQPAFREAVLAADVAGGALPLLRLLEGAPARLEALGPNDFPRLLAWSEGLCGLTLLPLRCAGGQRRKGFLRMLTARCSRGMTVLPAPSPALQPV